MSSSAGFEWVVLLLGALACGLVAGLGVFLFWYGRRSAAPGIKEQQAHRAQRALFRSPRLPVFVLDGQGRVQDASPAALALFASPDELIGRPTARSLPALAAALQPHPPADGADTLRTLPVIELTGPEPRAFEVELIAMPESGGARLAVLHEVTRRRTAEAETDRLRQELKNMQEFAHEQSRRLELLALTDELTGLPNRRAFSARSAEELARVRRYGTPFSLLVADIDRLKNINDVYGHTAGDLALQHVAGLLKRAVRASDVLFRTGGGEFCALLPNTPVEGAATLAERLRMAVAEAPCKTGDRSLRVTVSVGAAPVDANTASLDEALKNASTALYQAKNLGRNRVAVS